MSDDDADASCGGVSTPLSSSKVHENLRVGTERRVSERFSLEPPPPLPDLPDDVDANNFLDDLNNDLHEFSNLSDDMPVGHEHHTHGKFIFSHCDMSETLIGRKCHCPFWCCTYKNDINLCCSSSLGHYPVTLSTFSFQSTNPPTAPPSALRQWSPSYEPAPFSDIGYGANVSSTRQQRVDGTRRTQSTFPATAAAATTATTVGLERCWRRIL